MTVGAKIEREVLDHNESWPPAIEVKTFKYFNFVAFHVDRNKIERRGRLGVDQDFIECTKEHVASANWPHAGDKEIGIERGMNAGEVERRRLAGIFWRRTGHGIDLGAPLLSQSLGEIVLRFD